MRDYETKGLLVSSRFLSLW